MTTDLDEPIVLEIDDRQCVGCAVCADVCPQAALVMGRDDLHPQWLAGQCTVCGDCVRECPTAAIVLKAP